MVTAWRASSCRMSLSRCSTTSLRQLLAAERGERSHAHERAFEPADVGPDAVGEEIENLVAQLDLQGARFLAQDGHARFDIGRLQFRGQAPFETRNEPMLEIGDLRGGPIAREHDLFMAVEERVEGVEEFLLRTLLAAEELDVVDQEQIGLAIALAEFDQVVVLDRVDELVDEKLAREIHHLRVFFLRADVLADRLHQMRLAEADAAVDEERVVGFGRRLRDREAGGVRDLVVRPDDERLESVARIQARASLFDRRRRGLCPWPKWPVPVRPRPVRPEVSTAQTNFTARGPPKHGTDRGLQSAACDYSRSRIDRCCSGREE